MTFGSKYTTQDFIDIIRTYHSKYYCKSGELIDEHFFQSDMEYAFECHYEDQCFPPDNTNVKSQEDTQTFLDISRYWRSLVRADQVRIYKDVCNALGLEYEEDDDN